MRRQTVEGKDTNKKTGFEAFTVVSVTDNGSLDQGVTGDVVKSSQISDAFEGRSLECYTEALPTSLASQISLWHSLSQWLIFFFNWRAQFLIATRQVGVCVGEGKSIPDPCNTVPRACLPDKDCSATSEGVGTTSTFYLF